MHIPLQTDAEPIQEIVYGREPCIWPVSCIVVGANDYYLPTSLDIDLVVVNIRSDLSY
jgi:hypothetical protein